MKKFLSIVYFVIVTSQLLAQTANDYTLIPGAQISIPVNSSTEISIQTFNQSGDPVKANNLGLGATTPSWAVNGQKGTINPSYGSLKPDLSFIKATYTAPSTVPAKNPVAVSVTFHPNDSTKSVITLVCNVRIIAAQYKLIFKGEITGPNGLHYKLSGESYDNLKSFADGTFGLMPVDNSRNMNVTVSVAGVPGKMILVDPVKYTVPFVLNIGNIRKATTVPAKISIESLSPVKMGAYLPENYQTPAGIMSFPGGITHIFQGVFYDITGKTVKETGKKAQLDLPFVQRLKAHEGDAAYLRTSQGKADLLQMQKFMQEQGRGDLFKNMNGSKGAHSAYSEAFVKGMQGTQNNSSAYGTPPNANKPTVIGGVFHFDGTFNTKSPVALNIFQEAGPGGGLHGTINIKVEKIK